VVPAYRAERYLPRAVRSALAQDLSPIGPEATLEVVVVDDASPDGTRAVAERLAREDPRVRVFSNATNLGCAGGRNRGLREARGEWIAILDADDAFMPGRLARLTALAAAEGLDVVADLPELWDLTADAPAPKQPEADGRLERIDLRTFLAATTPAAARLDGLIKPVVHRRHEDHRFRNRLCRARPGRGARRGRPRRALRRRRRGQGRGAQGGPLPIYEPGLEEIVTRTTPRAGSQFTTDAAAASRTAASSSSPSARRPTRTARPTCNTCSPSPRPSPSTWRSPRSW
jgi:glycosyltransferase involved in cell wall biosynthesis